MLLLRQCFAFILFRFVKIGTFCICQKSLYTDFLPFPNGLILKDRKCIVPQNQFWVFLSQVYLYLPLSNMCSFWYCCIRWRVGLVVYLCLFPRIFLSMEKENGWILRKGKAQFRFDFVAHTHKFSCCDTNCPSCPHTWKIQIFFSFSILNSHISLRSQKTNIHFTPKSGLFIFQNHTKVQKR
jgi:hypothetical protein